MSRLLSVLDINDRPTAALGENSRFYDLRTLRTVDEVQTELLKPEPPSIDIFLVDINMDANHQRPDGFDWGAFPRYGPILALPFTFSTQKPVAFAPYSSYWGDIAVRGDGHLAVALSLLMTATDRRTHPLPDVQRYLAGSSPDQSDLSRDPSDVLCAAVRKLRSDIATDDDIRLRDIVATREKLHEYKSQSRFPDVDELLSEKLTVAMYLRRQSHWSEKDICLESLFMDVHRFGRRWNFDILTEIDNELAAWQHKSEDFTLVHNAIAFLAPPARVSHPPAFGRPDTQGTVRPHANWESHDVDTRKLVILFAWIQAFACHSGTQLDVFSLLRLVTSSSPADVYGRWCNDAGLSQVDQDTDDVGLDPRHWDYCRYFARTVDPSGDAERPHWMIDPDTPRGNIMWDRLMEMSRLFLDEDSCCVCATRRRAVLPSNGRRIYRHAHVASCHNCELDAALRQTVDDEVNRRMAHLFGVRTDAVGLDAWNDVTAGKRNAFRQLCGTSNHSVFEWLKSAVRMTDSSLDVPSVASLLTIMSMLPGSVFVDLDDTLEAHTRIQGLQPDWRRSIGGIVQLAACDLKHTSGNDVGRQSVRVALEQDGMSFLTYNGLGGQYRKIRDRAARNSESTSNRVRQLRDVYMLSPTEYGRLADDDPVNGVAINEMDGGLRIVWHGVHRRRRGRFDRDTSRTRG